MDKLKLKSILESLLFISGESVTAQKLAKICGISKNEVEQAIDELEKEYQGNRGLRIISKGGSYQMVTSPEDSQFVKSAGEWGAEYRAFQISYRNALYCRLPGTDHESSNRGYSGRELQLCSPKPLNARSC